ncbi:MAG: 4-alpha-glucanotransferase [Candidatus Limnocylindria bacterium]
MAARPELRALALRAGITPCYVSLVDRRERHTSDTTREALLASMKLDGSSERSAAAARRALEERLRRLPRVPELESRPLRCISVPEKLGRRRGFGVWTNLYALRSRGGFGAGDLSALARLAQLAAREGADFVGVSPLHALWNRGSDVSPYAPVSRLYRSELYLDVLRVPELARCPEARRRLARPGFRRELERLRESPRVEYERVAAAKREILRALHGGFLARPAAARARAYAAFLAREGEALEDFATFLALGEHRAAFDWRRWPRELQAPRSPAVARFRREHAREVDFHRFVQFELDRQLGAAAAAARRAGMAIGLYPDLALGSARGGAETWSFPDLFAEGASLGAPPDDFSPEGQDWAIPPLDPLRLQEQGFAFFRRLLRASFAHAGALRIDHVLGLFRLFWIPKGRPASEGAYVRQPARELLAILAHESRRQGALVIGEDLGTVPAGTQARLARHGILSSRVLYFERAGSRFRPARAWSKRALATANTHDLVPLAGFAAGVDLALRRRAGAIPSQRALRSALAERAASAQALEDRLIAERLLRARRPSPSELAVAVSAFLARTPCPLVALSLDDALGESVPVNLPGVGPEAHPSWTRRMSGSLERLPAHPGWRACCAALRPGRSGRRRAR